MGEFVARGGGGHASRDVDSRANEGAVVGQAGATGPSSLPPLLREVRDTSGLSASSAGVAAFGQPSRSSSGGGGSQHQPVLLGRERRCFVCWLNGRGWKRIR